MSIYGSTWMVDGVDHAHDCARWQNCDCLLGPWDHNHFSIRNDGTHQRYASDEPCTCNAGPIVYQGSHILPSSTDRRGGSLSLGEIAGWITRDGRDDGPEDEDTPWPWLRVTMRTVDADDCQDVVLDRVHVETLRDYLTDWLGRTEAKP